MAERQSLVARSLPVLTWGLTFHILAIALLFGLFHIPGGIVRGIAAWKEIFAVILVIATVIRMARGSGPRNPVVAADIIAGWWIALAVAFMITENGVWSDSIPPAAALFGVRDVAFFVLFYFVGRGTPELGDDIQTLRRAFVVLAVASAIAVLEQFLGSPQMLVAMGVASYVNTFLGTPLSTANNIYGLPDNYWTLVGSHLIRRSGSVFLSSQGFATPFLVLLPAATMWMWGRRTRVTSLQRVGYVVIWLGLIATFTRSVIFICALQLLLALLYLRRPTGAALAATLCLTGLIGTIIVFPTMSTFIFETLTWQSPSSTSHMKDWTNGITAFFEQPWGYGLGTTDQAAERGGLSPITADNLYLKYAVEMGVLGLLTLVTGLAAFALSGVRLMRRGVTNVQRAFGATVALSALGIAADGMTAAVFNNPMVAYLFFWFAGIAVTLAHRTEPSREVVAAAISVVSNA